MKYETLIVALTYFLITCAVCFRFFVGDYLPLPFANYLLINKEVLDNDRWMVKNQLVYDSTFQMYPWKRLIVESFKNGEIPTLNPYIILGNSLVGNGQSGPFYPGNLLFIFGLNNGWRMLFFLQFFLAAFFMFLYLRVIKLHTLASFLGGLTFGYSGFMAAWAPWTTIGHVVLWLPLMFMAVYKFNVSSKLRWIMVLSFSIFFSLTAGFPQFSLYMIGAALGYFLYFGLSKRTPILSKYWILGSLSFVWGFGLAALQLFPIVSLLSLSNRVSQFNLHDFSGVPLEHLFTMLVPGFFGWPNDPFYFGIQNFNETANYFGLISLFLFLLVMSSWSNLRSVLFWPLLFLCTLILAFDNFISEQLSQIHALVFGRGFGGRLFIITIFSGAVLAAKGFEIFLASKKERSRVLILLFPLSLLVLTVKMLSVFRYFLFPNSMVVYKLDFVGQVSIVPLILLSLLLGLIIVAPYIKEALLGSCVILLVIFELLFVINKVTPWSPASLLVSSEINSIQNRLSDPTAKTIGLVSIGENTLFHIPSFEGYDSIYPRSYLGVLEKYCGVETALYTNWVYIDEVGCLPALRRFGLKYLVDKEDLIMGALSKRWGKERIDKEFDLIEKQGNLSIYEFKNSEQPVTYSEQQGRVIGFFGGPNKFDVDIDSPVAQKMTVHMNYLDGWRVWINGLPVEARADEYGFVNLDIPSGLSRIRLEYFPKSLAYGSGVSAGFVVTGAMFLFIQRRHL